MVDEILPNLVQTLNEMYPDIKLHLYDGTQEELMHRMRTDELDMAFMDSYVLKKSSGFHTQQVLTDYLCAFISKNHPLADKECVSVEDLKKEDILIAGRIMASSVSPSTTNSILSDILINYGLITRVVHTCRSITNMLVLANCNTGVAILPKKFSRISPNGVVNKPIVVNENNTSSSLPINILLAWKENNNTNCSNFVLEALNKVLTEQE